MKAAVAAVGTFAGSFTRRLFRRLLKPSQDARLRRAVVEALEQRQLLTGTCNLSGGILTVTGTSGADEITVYQIDAATDQIFVDWENGGDDCGSYLVTNVNRIDVYGGSGADIIVFGYSLDDYDGDMAVSKPAKIYGEAGVDWIEGTDQNDTIEGGDHDDVLQARSGNDYMLGGYGGDDEMYGQAGADEMYGGNGNSSEMGADEMFGGTGVDTIYGENGNDTINGEGDTDTIYGGAGDDSFTVGDGYNDWVNGESGTDDLLDVADELDTLLSIET